MSWPPPGPIRRRCVPAAAAALPPEYRAGPLRAAIGIPARCPQGAVLVVGSGASGCQIVEDLLDAGRAVYLSVGRHRRVPRRYRGRDVFWWIDRMGALDQTLAERPDARATPNPLVTGAHGGHDIDLRAYARAGVTLYGHLRGARDGRLLFDDDVDAQIARGDEGMTAFARAADEYARREGLEPPPATTERAAPAGSGERSRLAAHARSARRRRHQRGVGHRLSRRLRLDPPARLDADGDAAAPARRLRVPRASTSSGCRGCPSSSRPSSAAWARTPSMLARAHRRA